MGPHPKIHLSMCSSLFLTLLCCLQYTTNPFSYCNNIIPTPLSYFPMHISIIHHKPIFYAYLMSESHTWDVVCERRRDPSYISTSHSPKDGRSHHHRCTKGSQRKGMRLMGSGRSGLVGIGR